MATPSPCIAIRGVSHNTKNEHLAWSHTESTVVYGLLLPHRPTARRQYITVIPAYLGPWAYTSRRGMDGKGELCTRQSDALHASSYATLFYGFILIR